MIFSVFWLSFSHYLSDVFKTLQCEHISRDRSPTWIRLILIQFIQDPVTPLLLLTHPRTSPRNGQRMIPDEGKLQETAELSAGKEGNGAPGSPGQSVLHTSVEPKYCFSSYIVTIKTELGEWCQSPVSRAVMHWTISLRDNWGHSEREFVPGLEVQGSDCWGGLKSGSWEKTFQQRSSETRMIHWGWIREFISFDVPCVWRDHIGADLFYKRRIKGEKFCTFLWFQLGSAQGEINGNWWIFRTPQELSRTSGRSVSTLRNRVVSMELSKCSVITENNFKRWGKNILAEAYFNLTMFNELAKLCLRGKKRANSTYLDLND